jgi:hypothetical protein
MKSILERALVHLLNEENEKAEELLHQYVIETARSIHENLREGDDVEALDDVELEEDFFSEADLDGEEEVSDEATAELGDDLGEEIPEIADESDLTDDTLAPESDAFGDDVAVDDESDESADGVEAEIEDFEEQLADLQAKFDAMVAEIEGESDDVADEVADEDPVLDVADAEGDEDEVASDDEFAPADEDEDFDDITESIVDELQKVAAIEAEGKGATGQDLLGNKQSLKFNKPAAKPAASKGGEHKGYARETAPTSTALKGGKTVVGTDMRNVRKDADAGNHKAANEGPKALLKTKAADKVDSTISGKPVGKK